MLDWPKSRCNTDAARSAAPEPRAVSGCGWPPWLDDTRARCVSFAGAIDCVRLVSSSTHSCRRELATHRLRRRDTICQQQQSELLLLAEAAGAALSKPRPRRFPRCSSLPFSVGCSYLNSNSGGRARMTITVLPQSFSCILRLGDFAASVAVASSGRGKSCLDALRPSNKINPCKRRAISELSLQRAAATAALAR